VKSFVDSAVANLHKIKNHIIHQ